MKPKFQIGDSLWIARVEQAEKWVTCPDCFGTKTLRVILGDGTEHTIDCAGCSPGYDSPRGVVKSYNIGPVTSVEVVTGIDCSSERVRYTFGCWLQDECNVFATKEEATERAHELFLQREAEEERRIQEPERRKRSWAWNVHYHRDCIRRAEQEIAYHTAKLNAAQSHIERGKAGAA